MLGLKEFFIGTVSERESRTNAKKLKKLKDQSRLKKSDEPVLIRDNQISRRLFLRQAATAGTGVLSLGGGILWLASQDHSPSVPAVFDEPPASLLEFEDRYQNLLLRPAEENLRQEWIARIAEKFAVATAFYKGVDILTSNFFFTFSDQQYIEKLQSLPQSEEIGLESIIYSNAITLFSETAGITSTVMPVDNVVKQAIGTSYNPVRTVGIICAHEMGHRTLISPKPLDEPFVFQGTNALMKVTKTQGLMLRGEDATNPQRLLNYLDLLEEAPAELQAKMTYADAYITPGEPMRTAPTYLNRFGDLLAILHISLDSMIYHERASDPFGLMTYIAQNAGVQSNDFSEQVVHGINLSLAAIVGNFGGILKALDNPSIVNTQRVAPLPQ